jgi:hypothetical protein
MAPHTEGPTDISHIGLMGFNGSIWSTPGPVTVGTAALMDLWDTDKSVACYAYSTVIYSCQE